MATVSNAKAAAVLTAQCNAFKEGVATFRKFVTKHQFPARDAHGKEQHCLSAKSVLMMLDCIEADAEDAAEVLMQAGANQKVDANPGVTA